MFVRVVPIRRLPTSIHTLTYHLPESMQVQPGGIVQVRLRGQTVLGIAWELTPDQDHARVQPILGVLQPEPVITPWLRQVMTIMATTGACSLGDVAYAIVPKVQPRTIKTKLSGTEFFEDSEITTPSYLWYRQRSEALKLFTAWIKQPSSQPKVCVTPTLEDVRILMGLAHHAGVDTIAYTSAISPTEMLRLWQRAVAGEPIVVIGTFRAIALPFRSAPKIFFDQAEHHAHKVTAQHPRFSAGVILPELPASLTSTSSAPTLGTWSSYPVPAPSQPNRRLASLTRERSFSWLTDEAINHIDDVLRRRERVWCIVPNIGYATSISCRQCGYVVSCPHCQRRASVTRETRDEARCTACDHRFPLPDTCPTCRGTEWNVHGIGRERALELIKQQWPNSSVAPDIDHDVGADITVGTYASYQHTAVMNGVGLILLMTGDALLNIADYATAERAWQFLARLRAWSQEAPMLVQTFQPELPFWQRWVSADDRAWYTHEHTERQRLQAPPTVTQWIVHFAGPEPIFRSTMEQLHALSLPGLQVEQLPYVPKHRQRRLLLTFADPAQAESFDWVTYFPTPWQVDRSPQSWRD